MRGARLLAISVVLGLVGALGGSPLSVGAQQGVRVELLGQGTPPEAAGQQLSLIRATFGPGGELRPHRHPGPMLLYIEAGALAYTLMDGSAEIVRAGAPSDAPPEMLAAGQGTVLQLGDQLLERGVVHAAHNEGQEPTVVLISALLAPGQPVTQFVEMPAGR
jgi:hypothetical protein